jgi:hypothetical protein
MNAHSFTLLCVDRHASGSGGGRATEAARQQRSNGGRAAAAVAEAAASSQQTESSGTVGRQDICIGGGSRAVGAEAVWQWQHLHKGSGSSAEVAAGRQGGRASAAA